jgi:hypothetical protein
VRGEREKRGRARAGNEVAGNEGKGGKVSFNEPTFHHGVAGMWPFLLKTKQK